MIRNKIASYIDILRNANLGGVLREAADAGIEALERVRIPPNEWVSAEQRAVKIAAKVMVAAGLCRTEHPELCRKSGVERENCDKCIRGWLLSKARQELKQEELERLEVKHDGN